MSNGLLIDCVAHYRLDETSNSADRVDDINGYDFDVISPLDPNTLGKVGNATVTMDGVDQAILTPVPSDFIFGSGQSFTIGGWMQVKTASPTRNNVLMGQWDNTVGGSVFLCFGFGATFRFSISSNGNPASFTQLNSNLSMALNTWYHLFAVYDGAAETMSMFTSTEGAFNVSPNTPVSHTGGAFDGATNRLSMFKLDFAANISGGVFDEIAVWRRALSVPDIQAHWNDGDALPIEQWDAVADGDGDVAAAEYSYYWAQRRQRA